MWFPYTHLECKWPIILFYEMRYIFPIHQIGICLISLIHLKVFQNIASPISYTRHCFSHPCVCCIPFWLYNCKQICHAVPEMGWNQGSNSDMLLQVTMSLTVSNFSAILFLWLHNLIISHHVIIHWKILDLSKLLISNIQLSLLLPIGVILRIVVIKRLAFHRSTNLYRILKKSRTEIYFSVYHESSSTDKLR